MSIFSPLKLSYWGSTSIYVLLPCLMGFCHWTLKLSSYLFLVIWFGAFPTRGHCAHVQYIPTTADRQSISRNSLIMCFATRLFCGSNSKQTKHSFFKVVQNHQNLIRNDGSIQACFFSAGAAGRIK